MAEPNRTAVKEEFLKFLEEKLDFKANVEEITSFDAAFDLVKCGI